MNIGERQRQRCLQRIDKLADLVADGMSVRCAAAEIGVTKDRAHKLWRIIKDGLGWQAQ